VSPHSDSPAPGDDDDRPQPIRKRLQRAIIGKPRDLTDSSLFHRLSLIPLLAWVGFGADGLSSSAYGPMEAFMALGKHHHLGLVLAVMTAVTVTVISVAYSFIIEEFSAGGGGYSVASKLLGPHAGVISGCALFVDYVLTITTSIAAAGEAIFSLMPSYEPLKKWVEVMFVLGLTVLNLRGVRESILALVPVFVLFLLTHAILIVAGLAFGFSDWHTSTQSLGASFKDSTTELGVIGTLLLLARAYSMGSGTYTGIEAVSNGVPLMREPRVAMARRTMIYMATSLSVTAAGLLVCFFLTGARQVPGKTLNAVLIENVGDRLHLGAWFSVPALIAEGALLVVASQTGFLGGPRILANMAVDSWLPRRFAGLSERLTTQNGIVLVGGAALVALVYTGGSLSTLVVMYSVNVFITFSLSMFAMLNFWRNAPRRKGKKRRTWLFGGSFALCTTILMITVYEKFADGAWITLFVTGSLVCICLLIHRHYKSISTKLAELDKVLDMPPLSPAPQIPPLSPDKPTAAVLVGGYSGVGVHTLLSVLRSFPGHFHNFVFLSVGVVDSGIFKGADELDALRQKTEDDLQKYVEFAHSNGLPAMSRVGIGTEVASVAEELCRAVTVEFPRTVFFAAKVVFQHEEWGHRLLHNETAVSIQRRLQEQGQTLVVMPVMVRDTR
jgi:amino acid transporter